MFLLLNPSWSSNLQQQGIKGLLTLFQGILIFKSECTLYRVIHKRWNWKDYLELLKYDGMKVEYWFKIWLYEGWILIRILKDKWSDKDKTSIHLQVRGITITKLNSLLSSFKSQTVAQYSKVLNIYSLWFWSRKILLFMYFKIYYLLVRQKD